MFGSDIYWRCFESESQSLRPTCVLNKSNKRNAYVPSSASLVTGGAETAGVYVAHNRFNSRTRSSMCGVIIQSIRILFADQHALWRGQMIFMSTSMTSVPVICPVIPTEHSPSVCSRIVFSSF